MGIYIPSMEMPENCICCDLSHEDGWCPAKQTFTDRYTFETCPLVPVPSHGRLGDLDALAEKAIRKSEKCGVSINVLDKVITVFDIETAPTVILAKKEG